MDDLKERLVHAEVEQLLQPSSISSQNPILGVSSPKRPDLKNKVLEMYVDQTLAVFGWSFQSNEIILIDWDFSQGNSNHASFFVWFKFTWDHFSSIMALALCCDCILLSR